MIPNSKRILSLALTLCMALSLLLTACGNGGDTPAGDNYAPGVTDNTPTGDNATPDTADTSTLTPATEVNETTIEGLAEQLAGYSPEPRTPAADISKYYSEDKKAFNILNYAKDLGFELSCYAADEFETAIKDSVWYNRFYIGKEDDSSGFTTFKSILDEQATFPFRIEYDGNQATYASIGLFSDENEDALFIKLRDEDHPINDGVDERVDRIYSMNSINYSAEKNILILGRSDKNQDFYKYGYLEIYLNEAMISEWCRTLEQIAKANNYRGAKNVFVADAETEVEQKLNIIFPAKLDISKYYTNAREFDLVQYAKDMGFEAEGVRWTPDTSKETAAINISRSLSNGAKIIVEYTRYNGTNDDGTVKTSHGIEVRYAPNEVDQYEVTPCVDISLGVLQDGQNKLPPGEISLIGFTDAGGSVIFVSQKQIERLVSIMQAVKTVNSEETLEGYGRLVQKIYDDFYHYNTYYEDIQNPHYN